jgi:hypothetical protein
MKGGEVISVNMHRLGEIFVENVSDVRRRATVDGSSSSRGVAGIPSANSRVAVGGSEAETGPTATTERYRATDGINACSRN